MHTTEYRAEPALSFASAMLIGSTLIVTAGIAYGARYVYGASWAVVAAIIAVVVLAVAGVILMGSHKRNKPRTSGAAQANSTQPYIQSMPRRNSSDDTVEIPTSSLRFDDDARPMLPEASSGNGQPEPMPEYMTEPVTFQRHWKMAFKEAAPRAVFGLAPVVAISYFWTQLTESGFSRDQLLTAQVAIVLMVVYAVARAIYRYRNSPLVIVENRLIVVVPKNLLFLFFGDSLTIGIGQDKVMSLNKKTLLELIIFRNVQSITIDTAAELDGQGHNVTDVIGAEQLPELVQRRKYELERYYNRR